MTGPTAARPSLTLCGKCKEDFAKAGRTLCGRCLSRKRHAANKVRLHRTGHGLCPECGERPPEPNRSKCRACLDRRAKAATALYRAKRAERVCVSSGCRRPPVAGHAKCSGCAVAASVKDAVARSAASAANRCVKCRKRRATKYGQCCGTCANKHAARSQAERDRRIREGLCAVSGCDSPHRPGARLCAACAAKRAERDRGKSRPSKRARERAAQRRADSERRDQGGDAGDRSERDALRRGD